MLSDQLFSKILVPIDGSEPSFHAAHIASNIANKFNSEIIVLYVIVAPSKSEYANLTGLVIPKQIDRIIENANEQARDWFNRIKDRIQEEKPNIKVSTKIILTGIAVYGEIIQYAEKENILIVKKTF